MKNELLVQMDGLNHDNSGILFIAATNLPWHIDPAFIRPFQKKIEVPLPDEEGRKRLFELEIGDTLCNITPDDYQELAKGSDGFSGSDIKSVVQDALSRPITRIMEATHFSEVG
jgi:vacuolar protein-sorting-associated protein 4